MQLDFTEPEDSMLNSIALMAWGKHLSLSQGNKIIKIVHWGNISSDKVNDTFGDKNWMQSDQIGIDHYTGGTEESLVGLAVLKRNNVNSVISLIQQNLPSEWREEK